MQIESNQQQNRILESIDGKLNPALQMSILRFLEIEIVLELAAIGAKFKKNSTLCKISMVMAYFQRYLNKVDRGMYYLFYEEEEFLGLQNSYIIDLAIKHQQTPFRLYELSQQFTQNLDFLNSQTEFLSQQQDFTKILEEVYLETDFPLPPCKRQTIGVYCETPFQEFMSMIKFPTILSEEDLSDPPLEELKKYFYEECDIQKTIQTIHQKGVESISKMSYLRYCPWTCLKQYKEHSSLGVKMEIEGFQLHNMIISLFRLAGFNAKASGILIEKQEDPIMKIAEFVTRANIYKNIILAVEEKFGFLFKAYSDLYEVISKGEHSALIPKFQFWNGAMTIWAHECGSLESFLKQSFRVKRTYQNFYNKNQKHFPHYTSTSILINCSSLRHDFEQSSLYEQMRQTLYKDKGISYESFFDSNADSLEILSKDYVEHHIDISINEINVHKVGHSEHIICRVPVFKELIEEYSTSSKQFYLHMKNIVFAKIDKQMRLSIWKDLIKQDLQFLDRKFTKPNLLKSVLKCGQELLKKEIESTPEYSVFEEEGNEKYKLHWDFSHKDNLLDYFAMKSEIGNDCPKELRCFYDVHKSLSPQQIVSLAMSNKDNSSFIESEIEEECYESSVSNSSMMSVEEQEECM